MRSKIIASKEDYENWKNRQPIKPTVFSRYSLPLGVKVLITGMTSSSQNGTYIITGDST
jgi:hypothetical protein